MKRPASVTSAIVVLSIILGICVLTYTSIRREQFTLGTLFLAPVMPLLHAVPLYGLLRRRSWSRAFAAAVLGLWAAGFLGIAVWEAVGRHQPVQMLPGLLGTGLLVWLVVSLLRNPDVPVYLERSVATTPPPSGSVPGVS